MQPFVPIKTKNQKDHCGNPRVVVILSDGTGMFRSRLVMMNFLHTSFIPKRIDVHHINEITDDDRIENLQLISKSDHGKIHHPHNYDRYGISSSENPAAYNKALNNDPLHRDQYLARCRKYRERDRNDPAKVVAKNAASLAGYHRLKHDSEWLKKKHQWDKAYRLRKKEKEVNKNEIHQL